MRRVSLFIPVSIFLLAAPSEAQYLKMFGVAVAPCTEGRCASLGVEIRTLPWNITQYRQMVRSKESAAPYVPLSAQEDASMTRLLKALLDRKSQKVTFEPILVEGGNGFSHQPSSFDEFRNWANSRSCTAQTYSLSLPTDKAERYGLIRLNCLVDGKKVESFTSVAFRAGRPVRLYTSPPIPVYGPAEQTQPERAN